MTSLASVETSHSKNIVKVDVMHRMSATLDLQLPNSGRCLEICLKHTGIKCSTHQDDFKVFPLAKYFPEYDQKEVDVEIPLMNFINNDMTYICQCSYNVFSASSGRL